MDGPSIPRIKVHGILVASPPGGRYCASGAFEPRTLLELLRTCPLQTSSNSITSSEIMSVTLHTSLGDIKVEVYCESVPKTAENFLALCASGYYDKSPFHRLIPKFMAQTGAPATPNPPDNPKGGRSIWGGAFEDEIRPALRHGARGVLSMANKGPGTNGSQ
ncbi:hypothetical protein FDECE_6531, partial [Fusarium decemcellulare]